MFYLLHSDVVAFSHEIVPYPVHLSEAQLLGQCKVRLLRSARRGRSMAVEDVLLSLPVHRDAPELLLETGKHPGELKDMVCSPAGTTIEAVRVLEEKGFRSSVIEAMKTCEEISKSM